MDIGATATAEASPTNAMTCVKPFTIPDKWIEKQTPPWDPDDGFDVVRQEGQAAGEPGRVHWARRSGELHGYNAERDKGTVIVLKSDNTGKIAPSFY